MRRIAIALLIAGSAFAQTKPVAAIPSYKDLKYPPLKQVKIPEPAEFTLSNGMRVFLLEDHELPLIQGLALIHTGNLFDPADKRGLSQIMADVLRSGGTKTKTGDQIDEQLEDIAGFGRERDGRDQRQHELFRAQGSRATRCSRRSRT